MRRDEAGAETGVCVVLTTCPDEAVAERLAQALVERRLAACVTRLPGAISVYRWRGKIEEAAEVQLLIKTTRARVTELKNAVIELHPYEEPEMLVVDAVGGAPAYLGWIIEETGGTSR